MRDDRERLLDLQEAILKIEKYAVRGRQAFERDELIQSWIVHHIQIIGEAARTMSPVFQQQHPDWSWSRITGMRNILIHHYFEIDTDIVWSVVEKDLPDLKAKVDEALKNLIKP
jgi:uncharacterized protein with HEPN domain